MVSSCAVIYDVGMLVISAVNSSEAAGFRLLRHVFSTGEATKQNTIWIQQKQVAARGEDAAAALNDGDRRTWSSTVGGDEADFSGTNSTMSPDKKFSGS